MSSVLADKAEGIQRSEEEVEDVCVGQYHQC